ncbi:repetitive organellar protein-like isoform X2 [Nymphalis io]|uniref:repetitive organellar protein-like isoform X2 n=1 Tax=Inachis io TaxID=171585 RepID=UPI002169B699|nr:repetitive organellar protein-like isoform X2 [Nymphalis io]
MEYAATDETKMPVEITDLRDESADEFQKFIHDLFENNGVLNDLRAYLRGHIVDVLQRAETGQSTLCHKNFTQRLELTFQAVNILIAEYLLRMEFKYSLSVFISEIPLSNMVFKFANALLKSTDSALSGLRFGESDIWSILNYLGIKCDSEHASKIVEVYKNQPDSPLLWCILKCVPMYHKPECSEQVHSSEESQSCSAKSEDSFENIVKKNSHTDETNKCKHFTYCKCCQSKVARLREKYKRKKIKVDEMFQQLKTVYDTEMDMMRDEKEKKIKRSIANHALQLQKYREELEQSFCARRTELTHNAQRRQRFLCELARRLAQAQQHLAQEEQKLKIQMQDAEKILMKKGEEMRSQISEELTLLQTHLETIKKEKEDVNKERVELENLKQIYNNIIILKEKNTKDNEDIKLNYDLLRDEVVMLRKYIETNKVSSCSVDRGTVTDLCGVKSLMNNENGGSCKSDDDRLKVNQVVNDLKKRKNVNSNQLNIEDTCVELNRQRSCESNDNMRSEIENVTIQNLKEENDRLKIFARQQSELIERLSRERRLQASREPPAGYLPRSSVNQTPDELGVQSRVLFPGDTIPFIGVVGNRQRDDSRRLLNQWRGPSRHRKADVTFQPNTSAITTNSTEVSSNREADETSKPDVCDQSPNFKLPSPVNSKVKEKISKTVLREAKQILRDKTVLSSAVSDKSSDDTIREAKLRLRKLEIEAEAVEKSYLDYKMRQSGVSAEKTNSILDDVKILGTKKSNSFRKLDENSNKNDKFVFKESPEEIKKDFDKYFKEYQRTNTGKSHLQNIYSVMEKIKPIPESYFQKNENRSNDINYLETPLMEFRKLYQTQKSKVRTNESNYYNHIYTENDRSEHEITKNVKKVTSDDACMQDNKSKENICIPKHTNGNIIEKLEEIGENKQNIQVNHTEQNIGCTDQTSKDSKTELPVKIDNQKPEVDVLNKTEDEVSNITEINHESNVELENNDLETNHKSNVETENQNLVKTDEMIDQRYNKEMKPEELKKEIKNLLIVEVENVCATTNIGASESDKDLLVVVESSMDNKELVLPNETISTQMTILVSPKSDIKDVGDETYKLSPEIAKLTENDALNSIYRTDANLISSVDMPLDTKKIEFIGDIERDIQDYPDDLSADVDNYNSYSYGKNSPISLPKTSEDDSFWDL